MTTDIEKQFFDTFGIEPEYENICKLSEKYLNNEDLTNNRCTWREYMKSNGCAYEIFGFCTDECGHVYSKERYPEITDTHYLKLICIVLNIFQTFEVYRIMDIDSLKEKILKLSILAKDDVYLQVQELFKERE